jgi:hypothetical protein
MTQIDTPDSSCEGSVVSDSHIEDGVFYNPNIAGCIPYRNQSDSHIEDLDGVFYNPNIAGCIPYTSGGLNQSSISIDLGKVDSEPPSGEADPEPPSGEADPEPPSGEADSEPPSGKADSGRFSFLYSIPAFEFFMHKSELYDYCVIYDIDPMKKESLNYLVPFINLNNIEWAGNYSDKIAKLMISRLLLDSIVSDEGINQLQNGEGEEYKVAQTWSEFGEEYKVAQIWSDFKKGDYSLISIIGKDEYIIEYLYEYAYVQLEDLEQFDGTLPPRINHCHFNYDCDNCDIIDSLLSHIIEGQNRYVILEESLVNAKSKVENYRSELDYYTRTDRD